MKVLPLVVVMLLVASPMLGTAGPTDGSSRSPALGGATYVQVESPSNETIHILDILSSELVRSTIGVHHVGLGLSLDFSVLRIGGRIQTGASLERTKSASDDSTQQQLALSELNDVGQRAITLQSAQRSVIGRLSDDSLAAREFLIEPTRIDAKVWAFNERCAALRDIMSRTSDSSISSGRPAALERELDMFTGPVRTHAIAIMVGETDAARFSVRTNETGVVLSVIADGKYVREIYRADLHDRGQRTVTYEEALDIVAGSHPTIYSNRTAQNGTNVISAGDSHHVRINYSCRQLTAYVGTGGGRVFKESWVCPLRLISTTVTATGVRDGLALAVDRTHPDGPLRIQSNESETGDPIDADVATGPEASQESTLLGHTGSDRILWTASPSAPYIVTVTKGNSVVVLMAGPTPTPTLAASPIDTENDTSPTVMSAPAESIELPGPSRTVPQGASGNSPTVGSPTVG